MMVRRISLGLMLAAAILSAGCCCRRACGFRPFGGRFAARWNASGCDPCCDAGCSSSNYSPSPVSLEPPPLATGPFPRPVLPSERRIERER